MSLNNTTTITQRSILVGEGRARSEGTNSNGFVDATAQAPTNSAINGRPTVRGGQRLNVAGGIVPEDTQHGNVDDYLNTYVQRTPAGHTIEINDAPLSERIMIRHTNGTGINIGPDGSVIISSNRRVDVIGEDHNVTVGGDGQLIYNGNLTLKVSGDFNVEVGGKYTVQAQEYSKTVYGTESKTIYENQSNVVTGNRSDVILGAVSTTIKGGNTLMIKGDNTVGVEGSSLHSTSETLTMTAETEVICTSPDINMAASNLSVFGATGTIGGEGIIMYTKNLHAQKTVWAETMSADLVYADLEGRAKEAITADVANSQSYADGSVSAGDQTYTGSTGTAAGWTVDDTERDTTATVLPTSSLLTAYQEKGSKGVRSVLVDPDDVITNTINKTVSTGGVTKTPLTVEGVRSRMRDPANRNNPDFIASQIASGTLSPEYAKPVPPNISRTRKSEGMVIRGNTLIGNADVYQSRKRVRGT